MTMGGYLLGLPTHSLSVTYMAFFPYDGYSETDRTCDAQDYHLILNGSKVRCQVEFQTEWPLF